MEAFAVEGLTAFEQSGACGLRGEDFGGLGDLIVGSQGFGGLGLARKFPLEVRFAFDLRGEQVRIKQTREHAINRLPGILHAEEVVPGAAGVLLAACAPVAEQHFEPLEIAEAEWQGLVAHIFQFGDRQQPARPTRMAGDENQFAVARARGRKAEKIFHLRRLTILVGAEQADVEVVARELEVVGVATVESDLLLRREDDPHIGVALEAIEMISPALPKGDHVRAQAGAIERFLLDFGDDLAPSRKGGGRVRVFRHGGVDARRHVFDGLEHIEFEIEAFHFLRGRARVKAVAEIILLRRAELLQ